MYVVQQMQMPGTALTFGASRIIDGIISSAYIVPFTPRRDRAVWPLAACDAYDLMKVFYGWFRADGRTLDWHDHSSTFLVSCHPSAEQAAIVRYLDHVDRRIRRYIRAKQKLIALLNEQKQAIIHQAVTRGLDPNVRLKPSGVEWLGDVPEHWEVRVKLSGRCRRCYDWSRHRNDAHEPRYW